MKELKQIVNTVLVLAGVLVMTNCCKKIDNIITDADGNVYTSVTIGTQIWMVENRDQVPNLLI